VLCHYFLPAHISAVTNYGPFEKLHSFIALLAPIGLYVSSCYAGFHYRVILLAACMAYISTLMMQYKRKFCRLYSVTCQQLVVFISYISYTFNKCIQSNGARSFIAFSLKGSNKQQLHELEFHRPSVIYK
jgi:hypothetical protein